MFNILPARLPSKSKVHALISRFWLAQLMQTRFFCATLGIYRQSNIQFLYVLLIYRQILYFTLYQCFTGVLFVEDSGYIFNLILSENFKKLQIKWIADSTKSNTTCVKIEIKRNIHFSRQVKDIVNDVKTIGINVLHRNFHNA